MGDVFIVVTENVSDTGNLAPRDQGVPFLHLLGEPAARFGDDLDAALDNPALSPVQFESGEADARQLVARQIDGFDDIEKTNERRRRRH